MQEANLYGRRAFIVEYILYYPSANVPEAVMKEIGSYDWVRPVIKKTRT